MINNYLTISDLDYDCLLPNKYQNISKIHWTPVQIVETAMDWCKENYTSSILDIGSGVGKFCLIGARLSNFKFTGVEKRKSLYLQAIKTKERLNIENVEFLHDNIMNVNFSAYDTFYYFNPFFEQIHEKERIDKTINYQVDKFSIYQEYVFNELSKKGKGTKVILYCSEDFVLPKGFVLKNMMFEGLLQLWVKNE